MEKSKSVVVNIIFLVQIYHVNTQNVYFTNSSSTWEDGKSMCRLVGQGSNVPLQDIRVKQDPRYSQTTATYGWIDALAAYQPWMEYLGCCVINPNLIQKEVNISTSTQLLDCLLQCPGSTYIGLKQSTCVCLATLTLTYPHITGSCTSQFCSGDDYALCAADTQGVNQYGFALYTRGTRTVPRNIGDCLVLTINRNLGTPVYYEPAPCGTSLFPLCYSNGYPVRLSTQRTWNGAVTACLAYSAVLTSPYQITGTSISTTSGSYWLAQIRKVQFNLTKDFVPGVENYCLAARIISDGSLEPLIRSCDSNLKSICYSDITSGDKSTPGDKSTTGDEITTAFTTTVAENTNSRRVPVSITPTHADRKPVPPKISDSVLALVIFLPGFLVVAVIAVTGFCIWRNYKRKAKNTASIIDQTTDTTYYSTPIDFEPNVDDRNDYSTPIDFEPNADDHNDYSTPIDFEPNADDRNKYSTPIDFEPNADDRNDLAQYQYADKGVSYYDSVDELNRVPSCSEAYGINSRTDEPVVSDTSRQEDETYTYDHITRSRSNNNGGHGYDTMVAIGNDMMLNGYHVVNSDNFTKENSVGYYKIASAIPSDTSDIYDCADIPETIDTSNQYDTVPDF